MVTTSDTLPPERIGRNGSAMCNSEDVPQEREICWSPTVGQHEERPDIVGKFRRIWGDGIGGQHLLQVWLKVYVNCVTYKGTLICKVYTRIKTLDRSN